MVSLEDNWHSKLRRNKSILTRDCDTASQVCSMMNIFSHSTPYVLVVRSRTQNHYKRLSNYEND